MKIEKFGSRSVVFTFGPSPEWDLNLHLILGEHYNYIIDTGMGEGSVKPIVKYIKEHGKTKKNIVINTHFHYDHIWGNWVFEKDLIIAHRKCRELLLECWDDDWMECKPYKDGEVKKALPNMTFEEEIYFPEDCIKIIYTPGHSEDCICILDEKDKIINVGDNIGDDMENIVPVIDTDAQTYLKSVKKMQELDFDMIISGHNVPADKEILFDIEKEILKKEF